MEVVKVTYEVVIDSRLPEKDAQDLANVITDEIMSFAYVRGVEVNGESHLPPEGA